MALLIRGGRRVWFAATAVTAILAGTLDASDATAKPQRAASVNLRALKLHLARDPAAGRVLGGITAQGWPVVMAISRNEKQVVGTIAGIAMSCNSGQQFTIEDAWSKLPIGSAGVVHTSSSIKPAPAGSGVSITGGSHSLKGRLDRRTGNFVGVWHLQVNFSTSTGQDQCDSGDVAFQLKL